MRVSQVENSASPRKSGQRSKRLDERGLHQVLDVGARADHPPHHPVHGADVGLKQIAERGGIASARPVDERGNLRGRRTRRIGHFPHIIHSGPVPRVG